MTARRAGGRDLLPDPAAELEAIVAAQAAVIAELRAANAALAARVAELERQLAKHSGNSSRPRSSDGLAKPPAPKRARQPGTRRPGKQPGAPGAHLARSKTLTRWSCTRPSSAMGAAPT